MSILIIYYANEWVDHWFDAVCGKRDGAKGDQSELHRTVSLVFNIDI